MELIRIRLQRLIDQVQDSHVEIGQYLSAYPYANYKAMSAANAFKDTINEIIIFIAVSISKSCNNNQGNKQLQDSIKLTPLEIDVLCKIKAKLEDLRYSLVNISSSKTLHPSQIYSRLQEIYLPLSKNDQNNHFKGATRGKSFDVVFPQTPIKAEQVAIKFQYNLESIPTTKKEVKFELSSQTPTKKWRNTIEHKVQPIKQDQYQFQFKSSENSAKKRIFSGKQYDNRLKRKRFNYIQDFQKQQQRLRQHYRILQQKYSSQLKKNPQNKEDTSQQKEKQQIQSIEQKQERITFTNNNLDDSLEVMKENQINKTAQFNETIIHSQNQLNYDQYSFGQAGLAQIK